MPIRTIKPAFFRSRKLARVSRDARLTLIGLWCEADGHGRGCADLHVLKGAIWPLDHDVTAETVGDHLGELCEAGQIVLYDVNGEPFFEVDSWEKHQAANYRRGDSQHPTPQDGTIRTPNVADNDVTPGEDTFARQSVQAARKSVREGKGREGKGSSSPPERFEEFWSLYPHKVGKKNAATAFKKLSTKDVDAALAALPNHVAYWSGKRTPPNTFIPDPPHPTTWLNGRRWEDELVDRRTVTDLPLNQGARMAPGAM